VTAPRLECRAAATGTEADLLTEAGRRLEAVATNLAHAALGHADPADVLPGAIRLVDQAAAMVERARQ
jgi:hypothetical protein